MEELKYSFYKKEETALVIEFQGQTVLDVCHANEEMRTNHHLIDNTDGVVADGRDITPDWDVDSLFGYIGIPYTTAAREGGYNFGRSRSCHVVLPRPTISGMHFSIILDHEESLWKVEKMSKGNFSVNGCAAGASQYMALRPDEPNHVYIQGMKLSIHVPHGWLLPPEIVRESKRHKGTFVATSATQSSNAPQVSSNSTLTSHTPYFISKSSNLSSKSFRAVHIQNCFRCVAVSCHSLARKSHLDNCYSLLASLGPLSKGRIIRYLERLSQYEADKGGLQNDLLITDYIEGKSLEQVLSRSIISDGELLLLYRQTINALHFIHQHGIEHRNITSTSILVHDGKPFRTILSGFFDCALEHSDDASKRDVHAFSQLFESVASFPESEAQGVQQPIRGDPEIVDLVLSGSSCILLNQPTSSFLYERLQWLAGHDMSSVFGVVSVQRSWNLSLSRVKKRVLVDITVLLDRLLAGRRRHFYVPHNISPEKMASKYFKNHKTPSPKGFCSLDQAINFCKAFGLDSFKELLRAQRYQLKTIQPGQDRTLRSAPESFSIAFHRSSLMLNLTHITEIIGLQCDFQLDSIPKEHIQDVRHKEWGGIYISRDHCLKLLKNDLYSEMHKSLAELEKVENDVIRDQFMANNFDEDILIPTNQLLPSIISVRRTDCHTRWIPDYENEIIDPTVALSRCQEEGLVEAQGILKSLLALSAADRDVDLLGWKSELVEQDGDDTEVEMIPSSDDEGFRWRRQTSLPEVDSP